MKKKLLTLVLSAVLALSPTTTAHAQDLSQYYAMSAQLMQMAMIMQAQAAQLAGAYGAQAPIAAQPTQAVAPIVDLQARQAQALAMQQAQAQAIAQAQAQQALLLAQTQAVAPVSPTQPQSAPTVAPVVVPATGSAGNANYFNTYDIPEQQQTDARYVLNLNTHKFHDPTCGEVRKIKPENYQATNATREEIVNSGYVPCGICGP